MNTVVRKARVAAHLASAAACLTLLALAQPATATTPPPAPNHNEAADHAGSGLAARDGIHTAVVATTGQTLGLDVSAYQGDVDWASVKKDGASFAYVKATESINYTSSYFSQQYNGAAAAGLIRGAYHFADPPASSGSAQADYFLAHGGGWTADGKTLPGALDIEYAPSGPACYNMTTSAMVDWVKSFVTEYHAKTKRYPAIYSTTDWWSGCTGNYSGFGATAPLWIASYTGSPSPLPKGWTSEDVWQNADTGIFPGDQDIFNGSTANLKTFALGAYTPPPPPPAPHWPTVQDGQTGRQVTTVQYLLTAHGDAVTVDGQFGQATDSAVRAFQRGAGLTQDGTVGPDTWPALASTVQQGSSGPAVQAVQAELNARGDKLTIDGQFGTATYQAVKVFQRGANLPDDGVVGQNSWLALVS